MPDPRLPRKREVVAYIDGYNLYHGIRAAGWRRFLWLDLPSLAHALVRDDQQLALTKYFTTRITAPEPARKRQSDYLEALQAHCGATLQALFGHFQNELWKCRGCGHTENVPHEKKTPRRGNLWVNSAG
jgi:hypothetical protein